ncbi:MAG: endoglucanase [Fibrobacteres bacterium]|nr:endoglucanase [Fibrobacterota bacterium]
MLNGYRFFILSFAALAAAAGADVAVQFNIDISKDVKLISPLIYGSNDDSITADDGVTLRRYGGNRLTGYNWENNASSAGTDYLNSSDSFLGGGLVPGKAMTDFHDKSVAAGQQSVLTLQAAGYVAKDKKGTVDSSQTAPSARWVKVAFEKGSAFATTPDTTDDAVYTDEFVSFMNGKYGDATAKNGVKRWEVDNEPALWPYTHPRIHPAATGAAELVQKTTALATAVKKVDPQCEIFGGVFYGYAEYANMQSAKDWGTVNTGNKYNWYIDYFLDAMKKESDQAGKRLIDVLDIHWYPEATGTARITDGAATSAEDRAARLQAPRSLWDSTYKEKSWITQSTGGPINLLPRIQSSIDKYFPGTRIAITEYNYGEPTHVTGGLAEADFLGVMGSKGVYASAIWPLTSKSPYVATAFRLFRNYDGQKGAFGSASAQATASSRDAASVFASFNPGGDEIHIIAINKSPTETVTGTFAVTSPVPLAGIKAYGFDQSSTKVSAQTAVTASGSGFTYSLPPWSATHFVLKTDGALPSVAIRTPLLRPASAVTGPAYLPDGRVFLPALKEKAASLPVFRKQ